MVEIPILLHTDRAIAVNKPPGVAAIPGRDPRRGPSLRERLEARLKQRVFVVHRLDRDTSGVMIFALDADAHRHLSMAFERGFVVKKYLALVKGRLERPLDVDQPLVAARRNRMRVARKGERGKPARTLIRPLEIFQDASLVEVEPTTGRSHQIRVHLLHAGHPLLVDPQYARPKVITACPLSRTPLHASRLEVPPLSVIPALMLEAPLALDMEQTLDLLRASPTKQFGA